jgi:KipI family sensor histidine kinase inhibitor
MRIMRAGRRAVLVELTDLPETQAAYRDLVRRRDRGELGDARDAIDVVPAARTVLIDGVDAAAVTAALTSWTPPPPSTGAEGPLVEVPVRYDGPDLAEVAARWGVPETEVARAHAATEFTVAFCGFSPGFAYLSGLPPHLHVPRRTTPRERVPAGSVGLAGPYCGIYPTASPGGWQLIGSIRLALFDLDRQPPALLAPGTRVRFVPEAG